jgi:hypothetical protein
MITARKLEIAAQILREPDVPPTDRLPYTPDMDVVRDRFSTRLGYEISNQEAWTAFVGARKRGLVGSSRRRRRSVQP